MTSCLLAAFGLKLVREPILSATETSSSSISDIARRGIENEAGEAGTLDLYELRMSSRSI